MFVRLKNNMGIYRAVMLICVTSTLWLLSLMPLLIESQPDMLFWWSAGLAVAVILMPLIRRHKLVYHMLIAPLGIGLVATAMYSKTLPRAQQGEMIFGFLLVASFYCHSALWVYGRYVMPRGTKEFLREWEAMKDMKADGNTDENFFED